MYGVMQADTLEQWAGKAYFRGDLRRTRL